MDFICAAISEHRASEEYKTAVDAELYYKHQNPTIMRFQNFVYNRFGQAVPDIWSPNNKIASNKYYYFTTQAVQYLLGNGVTFGEESTKDKLGRKFDNKIQEIATYAKNGGVAFGFWNLDHIDIFKLTEFVPFWDEESGALKAGIRFFQIDNDKPLRATLYELDGYTDYIRYSEKPMEVRNEKRTYKNVIVKSEFDGEQILDGSNYPSFPIVPFWNVNRQSDIEGNRGTIDAFDLMSSKLINNVSDGDLIYWVLKNCGGMDDTDDAKFIEQLKFTRVAHADGDSGASVDAHSVEVPYEASAEALDRLEKQLYEDFMALRVHDISAGNITNDQIQAAYEPINQKTDQFEYCVTEFIEGILSLAGINDTPTYTRSQMSNQKDVVDMLISANEYLDSEYITSKILTLFGDADQIDDVIKRVVEESSRRVITTGEDDDDLGA